MNGCASNNVVPWRQMTTLQAMRTIRDRLRTRLAAMGWSADHCARVSGVDKGNLSRILSGSRTRMTVETCKKLAAGIGVRFAWLADGDGPMLEDSWLAHVTPLEIAAGYWAGTISRRAVERVRTWSADNPSAKLSPPEWGERLRSEQLSLMGEQER